MPIAVIILLITLFTIAFRRIGKVIIPIWLIMTGGALFALLFQQITPLQALKAIEPDVMLYLFGVFFIAQAAEESGYLEHFTHKLFYHAKTGKHVLFVIIFVLGFSASLLMNDTIAIVGTPIILHLCKSHKALIKPLLYALAFSITISSVVSPIGNPQNLLIAVKGGMTDPFMDFFKMLALPSLLNLIICYLVLSYIFKDQLRLTIEKTGKSEFKDNQTVNLVRISLMFMITLVATKIILNIFNPAFKINFSYIAIIAALPLLCSKQKWFYLKNLDWGTLIFFVSTFILMQSVWDSGFLQNNINYYQISFEKPAIIWITSIILSQFISNVPLVALYVPLIMHQSPTNYKLLTLAAGSTIAGNLSIIGAASNIIIIQNCEKRGIRGFDFFEFIKLGAPLTLINVLIYYFLLRG
ncbi:MAG: anion transporter [Legionella sp.]|jgi:Na+/H+ antiporter NhaD/arsenite permease-like protein